MASIPGVGQFSFPTTYTVVPPGGTLPPAGSVGNILQVFNGAPPVGGFTEPAGYTNVSGAYFFNNVVDIFANASLTYAALVSEQINLFDPGDPNVTVVGSAGDTITGAPTTDVTQLIDASGLSPAITPGAVTVIGGAGAMEVWAGGGTGSAGSGDSITGGSGPITVAGDGQPSAGGAQNTTIIGGTGNLTAFNLGQHASVTGSTSGLTFIDDSYSNGGNSTLVGGAGNGIVTNPLGGTAAAGTWIIGGPHDTITGGSGTTLVNALDGPETIDGGIGNSTIWGAPGDVVVGGSGAMEVSGNGTSVSPLSVTDGSGNLYVIGGTNNSVTGGGGSLTVAGGIAATITGGTGNLQVNAITGSTVTGGPGNLSASDLGTGNTIAGSTSTSSATFIDNSYINTTTGAFAGGSNTLTGGAGNSTVLAGPGDSINGGTGALFAGLHSALTGSETVNLSTVAGRGAASISDLNDLTGTGTKVTVTGFNTTIDTIVSAQSVVSGGGTGSRRWWPPPLLANPARTR